MKLFCSFACIAALATLALRSPAATESRGPEHNLTHFVRFETGGTWFRDGDRITIDEIHGTSSRIEPGNLYEIKGTYALASHHKARLSAYITSSDRTPYPTLDTQTQVVDKGNGHFTLYWYCWCEGNPHLSFYPETERGSSFTSIYFGTGENVLKHASWLDDPAK